MGEYVPPTERPVVAIDRPILTAQQEQDKWLAEGIQAVKAKGVEMRRCMASTMLSDSADALQQRQQHENGTVGGKTTSNSGGFMSVVRAATAMLDELRIGALTPHNYYELYIAVFDEMQAFAQYVQEERQQRNRSLEEMYEAVQYVGHILPRLYLLVAVGSVFMGSGDAPVLMLFQDLVEMCKGVQHPTRGLFLRHFLLNMTKNLLPGDMNRARDNDADADGGNALDSARLLVQNAREMNWLWIRMEAKWYGKGVQSAFSTGKENPAMATRRTHNDRRELCVLVGMNIVRISQLEGINRQMYKEGILPQLMNIIMNYREPVAQQYLFEVIVQVFPDEFHLFTLDTLLTATRYLTATVDVSEVLRALMERLGNYVVALREGRTEATSKAEEEMADGMFSVFLEKLEQMPVSYATKPPELREIKRSSSAPPVNPIILAAYVTAMTSLVHMAVKVVPKDCADNISAVLQCVADKFAAAPTLDKVLREEWEKQQRAREDAATAAAAAAGGSSRPGSPASPIARAAPSAYARPPTPPLPAGAETQPAITPAAITAAEKLIAVATDSVGDLSQVLTMEGLGSLVGQLPFRGRRTAAVAMCESALKLAGTTTVTTLDGVSRLFEILDPLLCDQEDAPEDLALIYTYDPQEEFKEEQQTVCRLLHLIDHADPIVYVKMLNGVRKLLGQGGPQRLPLTFPVLASLYLGAAIRLYVALKDAEFVVEEERLAARAAKYLDPAINPSDHAAVEEKGKEGEDASNGEAGNGKKAHKKKRNKGEDAEADAEEDGDDGTSDAKKRAQQLAKQLSKVFKHLHSGDGKGILEILAACETASRAAFYAYMAAANAADTCELPDVCYEMYAEAFTLYEDHTTDSHEQANMLVTIINSLCAVSHLPADSYSTVATKACRYCSKLIKKPDQSRMIAQCANLFAKKDNAEHKRKRNGSKKHDHGEEQPHDADGVAETENSTVTSTEAADTKAQLAAQREVVMECLQRSLRTAKQVSIPLQQLALYVDLLNIFLHFFASKTIQLEASYINDILECIRTLSEQQRQEASGEGASADAKQKTKTDGDSPSDSNEASEDDDEAAIGKQRTIEKAKAGAAAEVSEAEGAAPQDAQDAAHVAATYEAIRQVYRNTTKYIRSRQTVDRRWEEIEV